ncbi:unnamed protein product [Cochlearia groenlandica]
MSRNENGKAREKSNFTKRCSLLSRYLKEKGSFGNIDLGLVRNLDPQGKQNVIGKAENTETKGETSNSYGGKAKDNNNLNEPEAVTSQLTIFYGGKVVVYNEFPADKAKEIIEVAKNQTKPMNDIINNIRTQTNVVENNHNNKSNMALPDLNEPTDSEGSDLTNHHTKQQQQQQQNQVVERIARRASLHRFFAKRKDRAVARAPYQVNQNADGHHYHTKPENVPLEHGQSSQRPDNVVDLTVSSPRQGKDKDIVIVMEVDEEERQCSKDLELRL